VSVPGTGTGAWNRDEVGFDWPTCWQFIIPDGADAWPAGLYAAQISDSPSFQQAGTAYFLVRPPSRSPDARILLCWPWSTTAAYACKTTGAAGDFSSLYDSTDSTRGRRVSLRRPFDRFPFGDKRYYTHSLPLNMWNFLRAEGLNVDPCTSFDLDREEDILDGYRLLVSVGHDEYWSKNMRDRVEAFVAAGGNVAFFSANSVWWQVRMEDDGQTMAGYKSGIEDPVTDPAEGGATSNWASSPTSREENTLTGVSFRQGSMGDSDLRYTVVADPLAETLLSGIDAGASFPEIIDNAHPKLFGMETDAAEYRVEGEQYLATGRDGTPLNFRILAVADLSDMGPLHGQATLGYYTNGGTVFTAATTNWAGRLDDAAVGQITRNVVTQLSAPAVDLAPAWVLPPRVYPTRLWSEVADALPDGAAPLALAATYQGRLLLHQADGTILRGDAESPISGWSPTGLPAVPELTAMGTDLYGQSLYATSRSAGVFMRQLAWPESDSWALASTPPGMACDGLAVAANGSLFLLCPSGGDQGLYVVPSAPVPGALVPVLLGKPVPPMQAITQTDMKLFGVGEDGQLYCREPNSVDLVWSRIGDGPDGKVASLIGHFGRLIAIVARDPGGLDVRWALMWRAATRAGAPIDPWLFFGRQDGSDLIYAAGPLAGNGSFTTAAEGRLAGVQATHAVAAGEGRVLLFHSGSGQAWLVQFSADGSGELVRSWPAPGFGSWTHIVPVSSGDQTSPARLLFYDANLGSGMVGAFDAQGQIQGLWSGQGFARWTHVTSTWAGEIFFYDADSGNGAWGALQPDHVFVTRSAIDGLSKQWGQVAATGNRYLFFYKPDGVAALAELQSGFDTLVSWGPGSFRGGWWVIPSSNGLVLFYDPHTGEAWTGGFGANTFVPLRHYDPGSFATGWWLACSIGRVG
jgi:hypothetical protein